MKDAYQKTEMTKTYHSFIIKTKEIIALISETMVDLGGAAAAAKRNSF